MAGADDDAEDAQQFHKCYPALVFTVKAVFSVFLSKLEKCLMSDCACCQVLPDYPTVAI